MKVQSRIARVPEPLYLGIQKISIEKGIPPNHVSILLGNELLKGRIDIQIPRVKIHNKQLLHLGGTNYVKIKKR